MMKISTKSTLFFLLLMSFSTIADVHPTDKQDHGYLRMNGRMWEFEDGTPYIPIGISLGGIAYSTGAAEFETKWGMTPEDFFDTLAEHGANFIAAHTNMAEWFNYPEFSDDDKNQATENLDWFLSKLQENGQYTTINLTHHTEFISSKLWPWNKYRQSNGGPCLYPRDFITNSEALAKMKEKIAFYNNWSDYRSFGVWQLSTEWELADGSAFKEQVSVDWHLEMADYIHSIDQNNHPVSGNLSWMDYHVDVPDGMWWNWKDDEHGDWGELYNGLFGSSSIDYVNIHTYNLDVGYAVEDFYRYNKPILITESVSQLFAPNQQPAWVDDGIDFLRLQTWSSLALWTSAPDWSIWTVKEGSSPSGYDTDMFDHFDEYCGVFETASNFVYDVLIPDWNTWNKNPELWKDNISGDGRIYATGDTTHVMAYIRDSQNSYTVTGLNDNKYWVRWYDTTTGDLVSVITGDGPSIIVDSPGGHVMMYINPVTDTSENDPPVIGSKTMLMNAITTLSYSDTVLVYDPDSGDVFTFEFLTAPDWLSVGTENNFGIVSGIPEIGDIGSDLPVTIRVIDSGGLADTLSTSITVIKANEPPFIITTELFDAMENVSYSDTLEINDPNVDDIHTFSIITGPNWLSINPNTGVLTGLPLNGDIGDSIPVSIVVEDTGGLTDTLTTTITVLEHVSVENPDIPVEFKLFSAYPNPFNPLTTIEYTIPDDAFVHLTICNISGQQVASLKNGFEKAGRYTVLWDAADMPSGIYFYRLEAEQFSKTRKMLLLK